jgi:hypothetical protein
MTGNTEIEQENREGSASFLRPPTLQSLVIANSRRPKGAGGKLPMRSELRELDKVRELLFKYFRNVGFSRIRADRHSHGDGAATQRTGRYTDVSTAPLAVGHFTYIVDGKSRRMQRDFEIKGLTIPCDTMVHVIDALNGVGEDRCPLWNIAGLRENVVKPARFQVRFGGSRYGLGGHKYLDVHPAVNVTREPSKKYTVASRLVELSG